MIPQDQIKPVDLPYQHEFRPDQLEEIKACVEAHGFAIIKKMISLDFVEEMRQAVSQTLNPNGEMKHGEARVGHAFMERCPTILKFIEHKPWLDFVKFFEGTDDLRFHRSAAIIRMPGAGPVTWHSDWSFWSGLFKRPPRNINDVLNTNEGLGGRWFYLEGTRPIRAGLAVIEDSHKLDWAGPEGFELTEDRQTFYKKGTEPKAYAGWDVPGIIPLFVDPGDMITFASRTYHYAFPHNGTEPRHSCGGPGLRASWKKTFYPWPLPESSKRFIASLPEKYKPYAQGYGGYDAEWKFDASQVEAAPADAMTK